MSVALSVKATDRGNLNFDDNGATVYWRCDTGNDRQEKFRLRDSDLQGDYWRYYKTEDGVGTVTREHPYVDLTVRLYRNPNNNVARKAYEGQVEQCPGDAEVWVTIDSEPALKVGVLQQDTYDEDRTSWKFTPAASSVDAGMIAIVGHDKEGRVHLHYFPSTEMLLNHHEFTLEFKRTETFHDGGFIIETWFADWDHISFDISRTYAIDYQQQLTPEVSFYKPGQMRFEVKGTLNECDGFEEKWKDAYSKIERTKMYEVTVTNRKTHASTGPITLTYDKEGTQGRTLDIDLPDYERATQGYDVSWTLTDKLQLTTKNEQQHVAGWSYEQDETQTLRPAVSPGNLKAEFNQVQRSAKIDWNNTEVTGGAYNDSDHYYVYRRQALNAQGDASNTAKWSLVSSVKVQKGADKQYTVYDNARLDYRSYYTYRVLYVPASWKQNGYEMPGLTAATAETPTDAAQHCTMSSEPHVEFIDFMQDAEERDNITLTWTYSQLPTNDEQVEFAIYRQHDGSENDWQKMSSSVVVPAKAKEKNKPRFVDNSASSCEGYRYKLVIELADSIFESEPIRASLLDKSRVTDVIAEKGAKEGSVLIRWSAHQVGNSETEYVVERRPVTSTDENAWVEIYKQRGTDSNYSYTDERVEPGEYYTYRVSAYTPACGTDVINENLPRRVRRRMAAEQEYVFSNSLSDLGFGISRGVVSGRVLFGAGTGVDSVRISLRANDEGLNNDFVDHSKYVTEASEGIYWTDTQKNIDRLFGQLKPITLQLWVMPTTTDPASDNDTRIVHLASLPRLGSVDVALKPNLWSQVTVRINGDQARINVNGDIQDVIQQTLIPSTADTSRFAVGNGDFSGYVRDVRVWNRILEDGEILSNWGRILNGHEPGLSLYWPLNEGVAGHAFDISSASGLYNQRHGRCDAMVTESEVVPSDDLLALYGLTDVNGDYTIRGIPFVGEGTSYSLIPTKGIHKFDYVARNVNIGRDALALSSINFVDLSSFTYSGTIRYLDTNIPVDSIRFAIDGIPVTKDGQDYCTGANGEFEFSVPIGDHYITATRNNHKTTRFPETGTYAFLQEGILNLYDSTLVNVAGRINGGPDSSKEPIGFQRMQNLLGQAIITLALDTKTNNQFNMKKDPVLGFVHKGVRTVIDSQDKNIVSENYYPEDEKESTKICIVTNMENGEFSAMLPPLRYKVQSIKFVGNDPAGYNNEPFFSSDLPYIDARVPQLICGDTLRNESGELEEYKSQGRLVLSFRSQPVIIVNQLNTPDGAFGISEVVVPNPDDPDDDSNTVSTFKMNGETFAGYRFSDYPLFQQDGKYSFTIDASEQYINSNNNNPTRCPVSDGTVHISNSMSINTIVCDGMTEVGHGYQPGDVIHTSTIDIPLSDQGRAAYVWCCGNPNLAGDHTRSMKITLNSNNRAYDWLKGGEPFKGVILGDLLTGTGFVTKAPDQVYYTMRDPGGAASSTTFQEDSIKVYTETESGGGAFTIGLPTHLTAKWGAVASKESGVVITDPITSSGTYVGVSDPFSTASEIEVTVGGGSTVYDGVDTYNCWKVGFNPSQKLSTGTGAKHIGRNGDSFFGASTNLYYGKGKRVYLKQTGDENFEVVMEEDIVGKRLIKTLFFFSEYYIVKQLIPEWEEIRNKLLISVTETPDALPAGMPADTTLYYTKLKPTDPNFGLEGTYDIRRNSNAPERFDSINIINTYIAEWKRRLGVNERAKYDAMQHRSDYLIQNLSIAGGSTYTYTHTTDTTKVTDEQSNWEINGQLKIEKNILAGGNGMILHLVDVKAGYQHKSKTNYKETIRRTTSYTIADPNRDAALSIDVYEDPSGNGSPIFITRGGQTRAPWEDGSKVEYYDNEDHSSLGTELDKATMKIEKCDLRVEKDMLVDLPAGDRAYIDLTVINESETGTTSNYSIQLDTGNDLYGASLTIDGKPVVNYTCTWLLPPGDHNKTLVLTPADPSVTEYRIKLRVTATDDDINIYSDWKEIVIKYQPSSAAVDLLLDHSVVNGKSQPEVTATISGLNRQFKGLKGVRLLYCREGSDQWITQKGWVMPGFKNEYGSYDVLNADGNITCAFSFAEDGTYRVKAQSFAQYGSGEVTRDSEERQVIQDRYAPSKLSSPSPSDGIITLANIDDVSVTLNEDIAQNMISKAQNVNILGYQNNISIEAGQAGIPQTALQLNGTQVKTPVPYDFRNRDFAYEFRYYRQSDGEIIGVGSKANGIRLGTQEGMLYVSVGEDKLSSTLQVPGDEWCHLALHYTPNGNGQLTIGLVTNADPEQQITHAELKSGTQVYGLLTLGAEGTIGRVSRLSLWSGDRSVTQAYQDRDVMHSSSDKGIEGCWLLDEGHGTVLNDRARNNNMVVDENAWYLANKNLAVHLDGQKAPMKIPAATVPMQANDNYLLEFWFRAEKGEGSESDLNRYSTLVSTTSGMAIGYEGGNLTCITYENTEQPNAVVKAKQQLTANATIDNRWHHFALNVVRGISATFYLDGKLMCNLTDDKVPAIAGDTIYLGGQLKNVLLKEYDHLFRGDLDEFRLWHADHSMEVIDKARYVRLNTGSLQLAQSGMVIYCPMESTESDPATGMVETRLDLTNQVPGPDQSDEDPNSHLVQSESAPPLKVSQALLRLDEAQYDIVTDERHVYFKFRKDMYAKMNGNAYTFTLKSIPDLYGNVSDNIIWQGEFDLGALEWFDKEVLYYHHVGEETTGQLHLYNRTPFGQIVYLSGFPSWIEPDYEQVYVAGNSWSNIPITIKANAPVGSNSFTVYVTDENNIAIPLNILVDVQGDAPDWAVDASQYANVMNIVGQIKIDGRRSTNTQSMVAAFDNEGNCRGVAHPQFVASRNAYYVQLSVYGESNEELTFRMYDADRNLLFTNISFQLDGKTKRSKMDFNPNGFYGSYAEPAFFLSSANVVQTLSLKAGWNWVSGFVKPNRADIPLVFADYIDCLDVIKDKTDFAMPETKDGVTNWTGSLKRFENGKMYNIKANQAQDVVLKGELADVNLQKVHLDKGWSWIGSTSHYTIDVNQAFAVNMLPCKDDLIKSQTEFAIYNDNCWVGTLTSIVPGKGYKYYSNDTQAKDFCFPDVSGYASAPARRGAPVRGSVRGDAADGSQMDYGQYSDNMSIVLQLRKSGQTVEDAIVSAYIGGALRGQIGIIDDLYFLTVAGNAAEYGQPITIHIDRSEGELSFTLPDVAYQNDIIVGTPAEPYLIDLDQLPAAIDNIYGDDDAAPAYDLYGRRVRDDNPDASFYIRQRNVYAAPGL